MYSVRRAQKPLHTRGKQQTSTNSQFNCPDITSISLVHSTILNVQYNTQMLLSTCIFYNVDVLHPMLTKGKL